MQGRIKKIIERINFYKVLFVRNSFFYRLSLDKKGGIFDISKFITNPWMGDPDQGRKILDCSLLIEDDLDPISIMEIFSKRQWSKSKYVNSFFWMRDLQSLGGNSSRKCGRSLISTFIGNYRKTKEFWKNQDCWSCEIVGERIVNWILSYSFFASGSNDRFQKELLSSLSEQFSHLLKCYKGELNPYSKLMAMKAILFCYCSTRNNQTKQIKHIIQGICELIEEHVKDGMFETFSPIDTFQVFRSLLEIRFVLKSNDIELSKEVFTDSLNRMASNLRFLRLGDGEISKHSGNSFRPNSVFYPSQRMIDTALSIVDTGGTKVSIKGYERLSTKKSTLLINTKTRNVKSVFNAPSEPGINIFDFEASFGIDRLINRSDIAVIFDGFRVKLGQNAENYFKKSIRENEVLFEGESHFRNSVFKLALRRELELSSSKPQITGRDFVFLSRKFETFFRFVLNKNAELNMINQKSILISSSKSEYMFNILSEDVSKINLIHGTDFIYPSIEIFAVSNGKKEVQLNWSIVGSK